MSGAVIPRTPGGDSAPRNKAGKATAPHCTRTFTSENARRLNDGEVFVCGRPESEHCDFSFLACVDMRAPLSCDKVHHVFETGDPTGKATAPPTPIRIVCPKCHPGLTVGRVQLLCPEHSPDEEAPGIIDHIDHTKPCENNTGHGADDGVEVPRPTLRGSGTTAARFPGPLPGVLLLLGAAILSFSATAQDRLAIVVPEKDAVVLREAYGKLQAAQKAFDEAKQAAQSRLVPKGWPCCIYDWNREFTVLMPAEVPKTYRWGSLDYPIQLDTQSITSPAIGTLHGVTR